MDQSHNDSHPHVKYWMVFVALIVCTIVSAALDLLPSLPGWFLVLAVLCVAVAKAAFVMTYFMHLKFEGRWKFIILMPTAILAVGLMVALAPDMAMHYYTYDVMQSDIVSPEHGKVTEHGGENEMTDHAVGH